MTNPNPADLNAPPGGGPSAVTVASTQPTQTPPQPNPAPNPDDLKLDPAPPAPSPTPTASEPPRSDVPDFGDPGLNVAADYFVNKLGLALDSPELSEAANGNYSYLEAKIAQLGDKAKGADAFVSLAKTAQERVRAAARAHAEETIKAVHTAVGGEANWAAIKDYASKNLKPEELSAASETLNKGGLAALAMAQYLHARAAADPGVTVEGNAVANPTAAAVQLTPAPPLTREQYRAEYRKLVEKYGITGVQKSPELAALNARLRPSR